MIWFDEQESMLVYSKEWERRLVKMYFKFDLTYECGEHLNWLIMLEYTMQFNDSFGKL